LSHHRSSIMTRRLLRVMTNRRSLLPYRSTFSVAMRGAF
jgi:hypothetical protein